MNLITDSDFDNFADKHSIQHQAVLLEEEIDPSSPSGVRQLWLLTIIGPTGVILSGEFETDGSYTPHPVGFCAGFPDEGSTELALQILECVGVTAFAELVA